MAHPAIPRILELATPIATDLGLEIVGATFHTNESPPVLRLELRNPIADTSLDDCERLSRALEPVLDEADAIPGAYVLEVSSPGLSEFLETDREFTSFKGFEVTVTTREPHKGKSLWQGSLLDRDAETLRINQKGRVISIPRDLVERVRLADGAE
ncbi:MAG: ribosome maturation factor RimP [Limnothrix sp.]|jgi:ribosome maturation factor RimP|uniref:Ribosome maturation factor RimP n=1 Tax=Limnothrix redekei LRLZ20PSL1 TaxID=3112953 RepID=A0ABW7CDW2_9CYAN|nr:MULTISPECIES: ribosome maturation factor RimP [unclassified Limnothrix]MEB3117333.1 ribosome maturation factor RimP [Limnothrix sp.]OCQ92352.1 ribosome maturation factor RimP [Limnothrix sp. P13C2]MBD2162178.1 ribosome maturation factor RimP [Limnothrix sp. FACHB-1083]MBD2193070.1 ribosome maturation factor RimP [Limnothrix sp. FACHB-1088]MBD2553624.1 ribosome maturation factor RimP [Limnothrix sp. FACHB-708]